MPRLSADTRPARRRSGLHHVFASAVGVGAQGASRLAVNVLIGRLAGTSALGTYASIMSCAQLLASVWPSSVGSTGARYLARAAESHEEERGTTVQRYVVHRAAISSALLAVVGGAGWFALTREPTESGLVAVVVVALGASAASRGLLYGRRRTMYCSLWELATAVLAVVLTAVMLTREVTGPVLVFPTILGLFVFAMAAGRPRGRGDVTGSFREMDRYTSVAALGNVAGSGFLQLSIVATSLLGRDATGHFAVAVAICSPLTLAVAPVSLALFPAVNAAYGRNDKTSVSRQVDLATRGLALLLTLGVGPIIFFRSQIIDALWGRAYHDAESVTAVLLVASVIVAVAIPANSSRTARSQRGASTATAAAVVALILGCLSWILLVPLFGLTGIALGYLAGRSAFAICLLTWERNYLGLRWGGLFARLVVLAALIAALDALATSAAQACAIYLCLAAAAFATDGVLRAQLARKRSWRKKKSLRS